MVSSPCVQWTAKYISILVSFVGMYMTQLQVGKLIMLLFNVYNEDTGKAQYFVCECVKCDSLWPYLIFCCSLFPIHDKLN